MTESWKNIQLTAYGDELTEPGTTSGDATRLSGCIGVGVHAVCRGFVDIHQTTLTHQALVCRRCKLRVVVPREVRTLGDLRRWSAEDRRPR